MLPEGLAPVGEGGVPEGGVPEGGTPEPECLGPEGGGGGDPEGLTAPEGADGRPCEEVSIQKDKFDKSA